MARLPTALSLHLELHSDDLTSLDLNRVLRQVESGRSSSAIVLLRCLTNAYAEGIYCDADSCGTDPDDTPCNDCRQGWRENRELMNEVALKLLSLASHVTAHYTKINEIGGTPEPVHPPADVEDGSELDERVERPPPPPLATVHVLAGPSRHLAPPRTAVSVHLREAAT